MQAREAAFLALFSSLKQEAFITDLLKAWQERESPAPRDFNLAYEIALGSCRRALTLEAYAKQLAPSGKLNLKPKEKALLFTALYQHFFMDKIPLHAIVNETVHLAKKCGMNGKAPFFNAFLRKLDKDAPKLSKDDLPALYSFPKILIDKLLDAYGTEQTIDLMTLFNQNPVPMARKIGTDQFTLLKDAEEVRTYAQSPQYYIQNSTPCTLLNALPADPPATLLDLCASPGGKLLLAHQRFPKAHLFANDLSGEKVRTLKENLEKYGIQAELRISKGEEYPDGTLFDLIIIDAPCSNSGVLHKRPEARWRYEPHAHEKLQLALIERAKDLLTPNGTLWYMTCSILPEENEQLVKKACKKFHLKLLKELIILPNQEHADGGYGAALQLSTP